MRTCPGIALLLCALATAPCLAQRTVTFDVGKKPPIVNVPVDVSKVQMPPPPVIQQPKKPFSFSDYLPTLSWPFSSKTEPKQMVMPPPGSVQTPLNSTAALPGFTPQK